VMTTMATVIIQRQFPRWIRPKIRSIMLVLSCNLIYFTSVFPKHFLLMDTFWFQKITLDPHILAHVNTVCLDDRCPKLNICISELILHSYEHIPVTYKTMHSMI
jgi:hypothetical protein